MNLNGLIRLANYLSEGNIAAAVSEGLVPDFSDVLNLVNTDNLRHLSSQEKISIIYGLENPYDVKENPAIQGDWTAKIFTEEIPVSSSRPSENIAAQVDFKPGYFANIGKKTIGNYWQTLITKTRKATINK